MKMLLLPSKPHLKIAFIMEQLNELLDGKRLPSAMDTNYPKVTKYVTVF